MNQSNELLMQELSMTKMALGQYICNTIRDGDNLSLERVASRWRAECPSMSRSEWAIATSSLIHYLSVSDSKSAQAALELLQPTDVIYDEYAHLFRGIYHRRGKHKNIDTFNRSLALVKSQFLPREDKPLTPQYTRCDKGAVSKLIRLAARSKEMLLGAQK